MSQALTGSLVAIALQKLEAIRHNEAEELSDEECQKRALEVAEAALEAIAVCTKYLLSRNAAARIDGFGDFYLRGKHIEFLPDADVLQYALLKHQEPEQEQRALRSAFVRSLSQARKLIPLLNFASDEVRGTEEGAETAEEKLLGAIFGDKVPNKFDRAISQLLSAMIQELWEAGVNVDLVDVVPSAQPESLTIPSVTEAFAETRERIRQVERKAIELRQKERKGKEWIPGREQPLNE